MPHIEVTNVSLTYDTPAGRVPGVEGVSFDIAASSSCASSAPRVAEVDAAQHHRRLPHPDRGRIRIGGKPVSGHGLDRGVVFQDFAQLFPWRTALGNVTFGLEMKGIGKAEREEIALAQLKLVKLGEIRALLSASPSGGCSSGSPSRARSAQPSSLLMDEPFAALERSPATTCSGLGGRLAGDAQDRGLRDAQCGRGGVPRRPRRGHDAASRNGED